MYKYPWSTTNAAGHGFTSAVPMIAQSATDPAWLPVPADVRTCVALRVRPVVGGPSPEPHTMPQRNWSSSSNRSALPAVLSPLVSTRPRTASARRWTPPLATAGSASTSPMSRVCMPTPCVASFLGHQWSGGGVTPCCIILQVQHAHGPPRATPFLAYHDTLDTVQLLLFPPACAPNTPQFLHTASRSGWRVSRATSRTLTCYPRSRSWCRSCPHRR